jgi:hypothetical protein
MKTSTAIKLTVFIISFCTFLNSYSQATATGYAGVSIVEAATASSSPITSFEISNDRGAGQDFSTGQGNQMNLGEIRLNSTSAVSCNMVLNPATLRDSQGNDLQVTLSATASDKIDGFCTKGSETIRLNGTAQISENQASGFYSGSYTLVFAFN